MVKKTKIQFDDNNISAEQDVGIYRDEDGRRTVEIHEFDLNNMHPLHVNDLEHGVKLCVIGKPGYGKSRVVEHIMLYKAHICPVSQIFSGTESVNHFYQNKSTEITIFDDLDIKAMENFAKRQDLARKYLANPWAIQILDDVTDDPGVMGRPPFHGYYKKGRHWAMIHIICIQYPMDIKPGMRSCIDYVFLLANNILSERQKLYENFASGCFPSFQDFCDVMDQITEDHHALVIDNTKQGGKLQDRVFYFKADLSRVPKDFKVGCPDAYKFNNSRMDPNYNPIIL